MLGSSPAGIIWLLSLKARTPASQAGDAGFNSRRSYCGYGIKAITSDCGSENSGSIPDSHIRAGRIAAIAADCKSADFGLRWFESNSAQLCLRVREVYGVSPLRRCAIKRTGGSNPPANVLYLIY